MFKGRDGAFDVLKAAVPRFPWLRHVSADGGYAGQFGCGRRIAPSAHRRSAGQPCTRPRQLAQGKAKAKIVAKSVVIIGVLIAAGYRQYASAQDVIELVDHPCRVTRIGDASNNTPPFEVSPPPTNGL